MLGSLDSGTFGNGRFMTRDQQEWGFWGANNTLFRDVGYGYMDVFITCTLTNYTFFCLHAKTF